MSKAPDRFSELSPEQAAALMRRLHAGDRSALDEILRAYWEPLVLYAVGFLESRDAAEDVVQNALIRLWERRERWEPTNSLRAFLYRITRNLVLNEQRARRVRSEWADCQGLDEIRANPTPVDLLEESELRDASQAVLAALPERRREVFTLVRFHGMSYRQVAEVMEISPQTVANQMSAALREMKRALKAFLQEPERRLQPSGRSATGRRLAVVSFLASD